MPSSRTGQPAWIYDEITGYVGYRNPVTGLDVLGDPLVAWALAEAFRLASGERDANGALVSGQIVWPDGTAGVFTADVLSTAFPGAIDAWHATYEGRPLRTATQPTVTRHPVTGAVTAQPAIVIS